MHVHWRSGASVEMNAQQTEMRQLPRFMTSGQFLKEQAANVLSRGEKKLLITALRLSQLPLLLDAAKSDAASSHNLQPGNTPVVLLDDITAELDDRAIKSLLSTLSQLPCQVFMTSLTDDIVRPLVHQRNVVGTNMFHAGNKGSLIFKTIFRWWYVSAAICCVDAFSRVFLCFFKTFTVFVLGLMECKTVSKQWLRSKKMLK